jgi:hypothetical protein
MVRSYTISHPPSNHFDPLGTTGYEEAAAQGIVAGINAGLAALHRPPLIIDRADGFVGVMIDDLIVKGAEEPCACVISNIRRDRSELLMEIFLDGKIGCSLPDQNIG